MSMRIRLSATPSAVGPFWAVNLLLFVGLSAGCPDDGNGDPTVDLGADLGVDTGSDSGIDSGSDSGIDLGADQGECDNEHFALILREDMVFERRCSPYIVDGGITGFGGSLTIEPGVEVLLTGGLLFGSGGMSGDLIADADGDDPIVFRFHEDNELGETGWNGIVFGPDAENSVLRNVALHDCGQEAEGSNPVRACIAGENGADITLTVEDVEVHGAPVGVRIPAPSQVSLSGLHFDADTPVGLALHPEVVGLVTEVFTYDAAEAYNEIVSSSGTSFVRESATWLDQGVPTHVLTDILVEATDDWEDGDPYPTLTLDEGVSLLFEAGRKLHVGREFPGGLVIAGTDTAPVSMDALDSTDEAAQYRGIIFGDGTRDSVVDYLHIRAAGFTASVDGTYGCLSVNGNIADGVNIEVTNSTFADCGTAGVGNDRSNIDFRFSVFDGNTFDSCPYGLWVMPDVLATVTADQTYVDTFANAIVGGNGGRATGRVTSDAVWVPQDVAYHVIDSLDVDADLELDGPIVLSFEDEGILRVAPNDAAAFVAHGEDGDPAVFSSISGERAAWAGIVFFPDTLDTSGLEFVSVEDGGDVQGNVSGGCITVRGDDTGPVGLSNVAVGNCGQAGIAAEGRGSHFDPIAGIQFADTEVGMRLHPETVGDIADGLGYSGVDRNEIIPGAVTFPATWVAQGVPYQVTPNGNAGILEVESVLTLEEGLVLEFTRERPTASGVEVGVDAPGSLITQGSSEEPVVFRSAEDTPAAEDWSNVEFGAMTGAGTNVVGLSISHAGAASAAALRLTNTAGNVTIQAPTFADLGGVEIECRATDAPELLDIPVGSTIVGCP